MNSGTAQLLPFWFTAFHGVAVKMLIWSRAICRPDQGWRTCLQDGSLTGACRKVSVPCHRDFSLGYSSILMTWQPAYPRACVLRVYRSHFVLFYERRLEAILHIICNILLVMQDISTHCVREHTSAQTPRSKNPLGPILETAHHRYLKWAKILPF